MVIFEFTFASSSSFLQSVSIRIFQLYRNSVIRTCIASERIITIITWVITSTTYKPSGWMNGSIAGRIGYEKYPKPKLQSASRLSIESTDQPTNQLAKARRVELRQPLQLTARLQPNCLSIDCRFLQLTKPNERTDQPICHWDWWWSGSEQSHLASNEQRSDFDWPSDFCDPFMTRIYHQNDNFATTHPWGWNTLGLVQRLNEKVTISVGYSEEPPNKVNTFSYNHIKRKQR